MTIQVLFCQCKSQVPHLLSLVQTQNFLWDLSICLSVRPSTQFSELFSAVLWDIDLKFGIWICLDMIQIKFDFCVVHPTFTGVISHFKNLVFRTFLSRLLWYWPKIWNMNLSWHDTDQVRLLSRLTYFYMSYCPLLKFRFSGLFLCHLSTYLLEISYMNLSWRNTGQV